MFKRLALLVAVLGFSSVALAQGFDGKWNATVVRPAPAPTQTLVLNLKTTDTKTVTGSVTIQDVGEVPIDWGMVKGDLISFKIKMPFNNMPTTFVYIGKIDGDQISFGRRPEDLTKGVLVEFVAKRSN